MNSHRPHRIQRLKTHLGKGDEEKYLWLVHLRGLSSHYFFCVRVQTFRSPIERKFWVWEAMTDSEEHHFESKADAGASKTYPQQAGTVRKNGYIVIKGRPCKVWYSLFSSFSFLFVFPETLFTGKFCIKKFFWVFDFLLDLISFCEIVIWVFDFSVR